MEAELLLDALLERQALFEGEGVGLGNDWNHIDDIGKLLQNNDIDGLEAGEILISGSPGNIEAEVWAGSLTHGQKAG